MRPHEKKDVKSEVTYAVRKEKTKQYGKSGFFKFAVCVFVVYVAYMLVQQQFEIRSRQVELMTIETQVEEQKLKNKEVERLLAGESKQYVERIAKDEYGYAYPDETIYIDTSGS